MIPVKQFSDCQIERDEVNGGGGGRCVERVEVKETNTDFGRNT